MSDPRLFIKLHNGFPEHPKTVGLSDKAFRGLIELWCYCSRNLTDGIIQKSAISRIISPKTLRELTAAGYLVDEGSTVEMHDYLEHQQSSQKVSDLREHRREAGKRGGVAKAKRLASASPVAKQTPSKNVADPDTDKDKDLKDSPEPSASGTRNPVAVPDEFEEWYSGYRRKEDKGHARKAFKSARKKASLHQLLEGRDRYLKANADKDLTFIAYPATWLNGERWEDETTTQQAPPNSPWNPEYHK